MLTLATPPTTLVTPRTHRVRGWVLVVVGTLVSIGIVALGVYLWTLISSETSGVTAWRGSYEFTIHTLELFADVFIFGLVAAVAGIYQLRQHRTSKTAMVLLLILMALMLYLGSTLIAPI